MQSRVTLFRARLENGELLIIELRDEQFRDPAQVDRRGLGQAGHAGVGQRDHDATCVGIGAGATTRPSSTSRATRRVMPDREMNARAASSVMRSSPPASAS